MSYTVVEGDVDMPENEALSKRLKKIRKDTHENQMDFAENCGVSVETLSLIECQKADPKLSTMQKIAAYINMTVSQLLDTENN